MSMELNPYNFDIIYAKLKPSYYDQKYNIVSKIVVYKKSCISKSTQLEKGTVHFRIIQSVRR